jgi:metal-responsive CopG/Arc/MetJ family transcriptional regulator
MANRAVKVTISLPDDLVAVADEVASEKNVSRSKVISFCLRDLAAQRLRQSMAEGYRALAQENLRFAEQAVASVQELLSADNEP